MGVRQRRRRAVADRVVVVEFGRTGRLGLGRQPLEFVVPERARALGLGNAGDVADRAVAHRKGGEHVAGRVHVLDATYAAAAVIVDAGRGAAGEHDRGKATRDIVVDGHRSGGRRAGLRGQLCQAPGAVVGKGGQAAEAVGKRRAVADQVVGGGKRDRGIRA